MTLYHFCAKKHVKNILRKGLTQGALTEITPIGYTIHKGWMWLTTDPDPNNQSWATRNAIPYSRTAYRLTIEIPVTEYGRIHSRHEIIRHYPGCDVLFRGYAGNENWRVFHGMIPREWIKEVKEMDHE